MKWLYLTLVPDLIIVILLIFNKKFSEKYNVKSALGTLVIYSIIKISFITGEVSNRILFWSGILLFVIGPFIILYGCSRKEKLYRTPIILALIIFLLLVMCLSLCRTNF